jgi:hypothetical protein
MEEKEEQEDKEYKGKNQLEDCTTKTRFGYQRLKPRSDFSIGMQWEPKLFFPKPKLFFTK